MLKLLLTALAAHEELTQADEAQTRADQQLAKLPKKDADELKLKHAGGGR